MLLSDRVAACHTCPHRQRTCAGACACTVDNIDIMQHAEQGTCPKGFYTPGLGDRLAAWTRRTGIAWFVDELYASLRTVDVWGINPSCGCAARRDMLNRWFPRRSPA